MAVATSAVVLIERISKSVKNPKPDAIRLHKANTDGEWVRQGDLYFEIIAKPKNALNKIQKFDGQLAEGSQRGSRHIINNVKKVEVFRSLRSGPEAGYILHTLEDIEVNHPDHGTVCIEADMWIDVTYQLNMVSNAVRAVRD